MNDILEQALLYDFYGELLTSHQKEIYEQFVLEDLSLSEIAGEAGISRQGVHDLIKRCQKALEGYEEKLHLIRTHSAAWDICRMRLRISFPEALRHIPCSLFLLCAGWKVWRK